MVRLRGELDLATAPDLEDQIGRLLASQFLPQIAVDASQLSFCDSSGLNVLIQLWKRAAAGGGQVVVRPAPPVVNMLAITGLDRFLRIYDAPPASMPRRAGDRVRVPAPRLRRDRCAEGCSLCAGVQEDGV
jgi:anti-sigma B factor antagonist